MQYIDGHTKEIVIENIIYRCFQLSESTGKLQLKNNFAALSKSDSS